MQLNGDVIFFDPQKCHTHFKKDTKYEKIMLFINSL